MARSKETTLFSTQRVFQGMVKLALDLPDGNRNGNGVFMRL